MSQPRPTDPIGSIGWTERTGGVLTARECLTLAGPLLFGLNSRVVYSLPATRSARSIDGNGVTEAVARSVLTPRSSGSPPQPAGSSAAAATRIKAGRRIRRDHAR